MTPSLGSNGSWGPAGAAGGGAFLLASDFREPEALGARDAEDALPEGRSPAASASCSGTGESASLGIGAAGLGRPCCHGNGVAAQGTEAAG